MRACARASESVIPNNSSGGKYLDGVSRYKGVKKALSFHSNVLLAASRYSLYL